MVETPRKTLENSPGWGCQSENMLVTWDTQLDPTGTVNGLRMDYNPL
jgi:hypothetical protein